MDLLRVADNHHVYPIDQMAHDRLPIDCCCRLGLPDRGDIRCQCSYFIAFVRAQDRKLLGEVTPMVLLELLLSAELFLKLPLKGTSDQAVFGFDRVILPTSALDFELGSFEALHPDTFAPLALSLDIRRGPQAEFQRRRLDRLQHEIFDSPI